MSIDQYKGGDRTLLFCLVASMGGFLAGFHSAVISGAISQLESYFELSSAGIGWVISSMLLGCALGALGAGNLAEQYGRKKVMMLIAVFFFASSALTAYPPSFSALIFARILGGLAIGMSTVLCPMYISDISDNESRGKMVSLFQMGMVVGILITYISNSYISGLGTDSWQLQTGWRMMFLVELLPALAFGLALIVLPESPRWLISKSRKKTALTELRKIKREKFVKSEFEEMLSSSSAENNQEDSSWKTLFHARYRTIVICGLILAVFSQTTGINAILYYAPEIFKKLGGGSEMAMMQTVGIGLINFAFTILAIWLIDKAGRRFLLLLGSIGMSVSLGCVTFCFYSGMQESILVFISILAFIAFFAISWGPVTFVLISEIFPQSIKSKAMSLAVLSLWTAVFVVSQLFPMLLESAGEMITFGIFLGSAVLSLMFVWKFIPETKEKSFKEIEKEWTKQDGQVKQNLKTAVS
ncbi:sugar porter family MFS transporter [Aureibacter tunicatorum]|uniref:SP family arabinose:H+ symporter-like MFS transporter n=1 Tax=Aureibacter tunicatorum TaxID=866807 RepID=A0AAE3XK72_9BACT|nr:sugar porter family MFS transporter [Aureibacter tunicatorum]MDR6237286.1 SP family arabinose:H+ symporter-like MFS transporter [Aureibacter tunicatorum]BDD06277.1 arabinose-proton symporter [Aureibacter tunicatorum]